MINFLKGRYFQVNQQEKFYAVLMVGLFFSFFMIFFQPFGVNNYDPKESISLFFVLTIMGMGVYLTLLLLINEFLIFPFFFHGEIYRWQIFFWLIWSNLFAASGLFIYYNFLGEWHDFRFSSWLEFISNFTALSIIPLTAIYFYGKMKHLQNRTETTVDYQTEASSIINIPSDSQSNLNSFALDSILYLESEDNYVAVYSIQKNEASKTLIRTTLKKIEDLELHPALIRYHRSFMINLIHLAKYDGNRQHGLLTLKHKTKPIPVSKSYASNLLLRLK